MSRPDPHDLFPEWPEDRADKPLDRAKPNEPLDDDGTMDSLRAPLSAMPDLTASILSAVDQRREFLCDKTRWWVKAFRVAACVAIAGGALTAVLAWRYAPESTTLVETPPTPAMLLLSATDAQACQSPAAIRSGLNSVSAVEPARLLTIVVNPTSNGQSSMQITVGVAQPLPCACRWKTNSGVRSNFAEASWPRMPFGIRVMSTGGAIAIISPNPTSVHTPQPAPEPLQMPTVRFVSMGSEPASVAGPSGEFSNVLAWQWSILTQPFSSPRPAELISSQAPADVALQTVQTPEKIQPAKASSYPLADGVGNLLGGSGGWMGDSAPGDKTAGTEAGTDGGVGR